MRAKPANDKNPHDEDEPLEPLWVDDDGVVVAPEFVAPEPAHVDAKTLARDYAAAFRTVLRERAEVRAQPPWNVPTVVAPTKPRASTFHSTFSRMIGLPPARLVGMHDWWRASARDGRVRVTRRLSLEEPRPAPGGTWRTCGRLRSPWGVRSIPGRAPAVAVPRWVDEGLARTPTPGARRPPLLPAWASRARHAHGATGRRIGTSLVARPRWIAWQRV